MIRPTPALPSQAQVSEAVEAALPAIMMDARRAAASIVMGEHGKRRAGIGDAFWQHREWHNGESIRQIDWRRSARSDRLFVRERESEVPALLQIWCDGRASMDWRSTDSLPTKAHRGLIIGLALAMATRAGGERVCALGNGTPMADAMLFARILANSGQAFGDKVFAGQALIVSDGLEAPEIWEQRVRAVRGARAELSVVLVADPAEADFPYQGRVSFQATQDALPITIGRAQSAQADYRRAYQHHIDTTRAIIRASGGQVFQHTTDQPAVPTLLTLASALGGVTRVGRAA